MDGERKMDLYELVVGQNGLLVELRMQNSFNEQIFENITDYLNVHLDEWKAKGAIPIADAVPIFNLIDDLAGGSKFWSEEIGLRVEDAVLEIQEIISALED
jgi:hypothetical protein